MSYDLTIFWNLYILTWKANSCILWSRKRKFQNSLNLLLQTENSKFPLFFKQTNLPASLWVQATGSALSLHTLAPSPSVSSSVMWWNALLGIHCFYPNSFPLKVKTWFSIVLPHCPLPPLVSCARLGSNKLFLLQISWFHLNKFWWTGWKLYPFLSEKRNRFYCAEGPRGTYT